MTPEAPQLLDSVRAIRARSRLVLAIVLVAMGVAVAISLSSAKQYDATAQLLLRGEEPVNSLLDPAGTAARSNDPERELNTQVELIKVGPSAHAVQRALGLSRSTDALLEAGPDRDEPHLGPRRAARARRRPGPRRPDRQRVCRRLRPVPRRLGPPALPPGRRPGATAAARAVAGRPAHRRGPRAAGAPARAADRRRRCRPAAQRSSGARAFPRARRARGRCSAAR